MSVSFLNNSVEKFSNSSDYLNGGEKYLSDKINGRDNSVEQYKSMDDIISENEERDESVQVFLEPTVSEQNQPAPNNNYKNPLLNSYEEIVSSTSKVDDNEFRKGARSMINPMALISYHKGDPNNLYNYLSDYRGYSGEKINENLTIENLVNSFNDKDYPIKPYRFSDFVFTKYYEKIPLNRLITLRRYPFPTFDNLTFPADKKIKPVAQAVTYFGEPTNNNLKSLLNIKGKIGWKELKASYENISGNEQSMEQTPFSGKLGTVSKNVARGMALITGKNDVSQRQWVEIQAEKNFNWENTVRGKSDVIAKTHIREKGIEAGVGTYTVEFEYVMRSFNGINGKVALLDVIFNFLSLVYNHADFWGGERRYFPNSPRYPFIGGKEGQDAFYRGDYGEYARIIAGDLTETMGSIGSTFAGIIGGLLQGDFTSLIDTIKNVGTSLLDIASGKNRPQLINFKALLSGEPVGNWHLTIGSPFDPINMVGNLVVTDWSLETSEELGIDNFPTSIKFTVNLKDAMPRDKGGIESMFLEGNGHGYLKPSDFNKELGLYSGGDSEVTEDDIKRAGGSVY